MDGDGPRAYASARTRWLGFALGVAMVAGASAAFAQHVEADRPLTVILGSAEGGATTERLDVARTNLSTSLLPTHSLRVVWTRHVAPVYEPPVVFADGTVVVISEDGEALLVNRDGTDLGRVSLGPGPVSAPSLLADGTMLVVNGTGEAVGVRRGAIVFRIHVVDVDGALEGDESGGVRRSALVHGYGVHVPRLRRASAPRVLAGLRARTLPLDDGGAMVALGRELVCVDAAGGVRARAIAPVAVASPLLATARGVAFVAESGEAYVWERQAAADTVFARGAFGGSVEGAVAADGPNHLVAIVDGSRLVSLDLTTEEASTRARAGGGTVAGAFTGAFALAVRSGRALVEEVTLLGTRVLVVDRDGQTTPFATLLTSQGAQPAPDAGATAFFAPTHTALFADPTGSVAYGTIDGHVGVASASAKVELGALPCGVPPAAAPRSGFGRPERPSAGFAGIVPSGPGAFVIACENGRISLVEGDARP